VTVAHGVASVIISWWAYCSSTRALGYPLFPSTDTRVVLLVVLVAVVLRVQVLRSTHNCRLKVPRGSLRLGWVGTGTVLDTVLVKGHCRHGLLSVGVTVGNAELCADSELPIASEFAKCPPQKPQNAKLPRATGLHCGRRGQRKLRGFKFSPPGPPLTLKEH
jgi:hypothetical protein